MIWIDKFGFGDKDFGANDGLVGRQCHWHFPLKSVGVLVLFESHFYFDFERQRIQAN